MSEFVSEIQDCEGPPTPRDRTFLAEPICVRSKHNELLVSFPHRVDFVRTVTSGSFDGSIPGPRGEHGVMANDPTSHISVPLYLPIPSPLAVNEDTAHPIASCLDSVELQRLGSHRVPLLLACPNSASPHK